MNTYSHNLLKTWSVTLQRPAKPIVPPNTAHHERAASNRLVALIQTELKDLSNPNRRDLLIDSKPGCCKTLAEMVW